MFSFEHSTKLNKLYMKTERKLQRQFAKAPFLHTARVGDVALRRDAPLYASRRNAAWRNVLRILTIKCVPFHVVNKVYFGSPY